MTECLDAALQISQSESTWESDSEPEPETTTRTIADSKSKTGTTDGGKIPLYLYGFWYFTTPQRAELVTYFGQPRKH